MVVVDINFKITQRFAGKETDEDIAATVINNIIEKIDKDLALRPDLQIAIDREILSPKIKIKKYDDISCLVKFELGFVVSDKALVQPLRDYIGNTIDRPWTEDELIN